MKKDCVKRFIYFLQIFLCQRHFKNLECIIIKLSIFMMFKHLIRPLALLKKINKTISPQTVYTFNTIKKTYATNKKSSIKQENMDNIMIKNENLKFNAQGYWIHLYPFHPEVIKKATNVYEINKSSSILGLNFIEIIPESQQNNVQKSKQNWRNRKSAAFRFNELSKFFQVNVEESQTWSIEVDRSYKGQKKLKILTLNNENNSKFLNISLEQDSSQNKWKIETKMSHQQFSLLQFLLKESLYDLSGMRLMFDLRRNEELAKMGEKDKVDVEKESLFRNYDSKDDVV